MKSTKRLFITITVIAVGLLSVAMTGFDLKNWSIDPSHSSIDFKVRHFFTPVSGSFEEYNSEIYFNPEEPENSSIDVTIQVSSINTENEKRDGHLLSGDFFGAEQFPTINFKSTDIEKTGENEFVAHGTLSIKDVTKEFDLPFTLLGIAENAFNPEKLVAGITATAKLNRNDFGVGTGDWVSDAVVGDEVSIEINLELGTEK